MPVPGRISVSNAALNAESGSWRAAVPASLRADSCAHDDHAEITQFYEDQDTAAEEVAGEPLVAGDLLPGTDRFPPRCVVATVPSSRAGAAADRAGPPSPSSPCGAPPRPAGM